MDRHNARTVDLGLKIKIDRWIEGLKNAHRYKFMLKYEI
jgi:hypothetical protein